MSDGPLLVACLRHADPAPAVDPLSGAVARDAGRARLTASDAAALEHALMLAGAWSGHVLAVTAGPAAAEATLREALALGAAAVRVPWPPGAGAGELEPEPAYLADLAADERALARALAAAMREAGAPALVLTGDRSADRGTGALGGFLAHELGAAQALGLVELRAEGDALMAERRLDGGRRERLRVGRPAVVSVEAAGVRLRRAALPAARAAALAAVPVSATAAAAGRRAAGAEAITVQAVRPYRPRTRAIAPPAGAAPRERVLALTGALAAQEPPTIVGPLDASAAADELLAFLRRTGYLEE